jgi:hypothetical protein
MSIPDNSHEEAIIAVYSTPSLRRNELTRYGKAWQLYDLKLSGAEISDILARLYLEPEKYENAPSG